MLRRGITRPYHFDESISNSRAGGGKFQLHSNYKSSLYEQTMQSLIKQNSASDPSFHCLPMSHKKDARL